MIIAERFCTPNSCPADCRYIDDFYKYGQNAICGRCPVFVCKEPETEEDYMFMPLVPAKEYRPDWAEEWEQFFKTGRPPILNF